MPITRKCKPQKTAGKERHTGRIYHSSRMLCMVYCPLLQTTMLFAMPPKAAAKPAAL
ncbi:MAG: hypothetical protein Q4D37_04900 [Oscillospiraceae bacterium]|nr:hypothetical protein [Oscillospiraceae bacterium]